MLIPRLNLKPRARSPATPARFMEWFSCSCMIGS
nr:MAG TPA: hypothetical protein [Caudoviricetes sp.]